jgi:nucleoside-diphosphate-sugar epimerase
MSKVLILGGTSWVGGQLAREAVVRGHDVTCLARGESGNAPAAVTFVQADRDQPDAYDKVNDQRWDFVIDVARQPGQVRSAVDVLGGTSSHWTLISTGSVYADQSGALTEESPLLEPLEDDVAGPEKYGEGKVACEQVVRTLSRHLVVRAGLIGGPGDPSGRLGYYVSRFALAGDEPVLVPGVADQPMQVIDVRDLARWVVIAAEHGVTGIVHGVGEPTTVGELLQASAEVAGFEGQQVEADPEWLRQHDVQEWMGPRSLPWWLPESHHGMGLMDETRLLEHGLERRSLVETLRDTLEDQKVEAEREPRAGLTREDELELIMELRPGAGQTSQ